MNVLKLKPFHFDISMEKLDLESAKLKGDLLKYRHVFESLNILYWIHGKHSVCEIIWEKNHLRGQETF